MDKIVLDKKTQTDWHLLTTTKMRELFPNAVIYTEKIFGIPKSIIAIKE